MSSEPSSGLLVIVELGAAWPNWLVEGSAHGTRRVLAELEGEGPASFAARVLSVAAGLMPRGVRLDLAVLAVNERADETQMRARRELVRALLYSKNRRSTRLSVTATAAPGERLHLALFGLETGIDAIKGLSDRISIYFGERMAEPVSSPMPEVAASAVA